MNILKEALLECISSAIDDHHHRHADICNTCVSTRNNALESAAELVLSLPDDHPLFAVLEKANEANGEGWVENESRFLFHWGFTSDSPVAGYRFVSDLYGVADGFLDEWAEELEVRKMTPEQWSENYDVLAAEQKDDERVAWEEEYDDEAACEKECAYEEWEAEYDVEHADDKKLAYEAWEKVRA